MPFRNQKGSFALVALFGLGIVLSMVGVYYAMYGGEGERKLATDPKLVMNELQERVERALANPAAIDASVERNPNQFACLSTVSAACRGQGGTFLLYEGPHSQPVSQLMRDAGISFDGGGCSGFPSEGCPFRVETQWVPVCGPGNCENTKSFRVNAKVVHQPGPGVQPDLWTKEALFTPVLRLSLAVQCERGGGVWAGTECLTADQAAQRRIASSQRGQRAEPPREGLAQAREVYDREREENPAAVPEQTEYVCPSTIVVQGQFYTLEFLAPGRGQVRVPALNGCPAEDLFVFQCTAKNPATFEGEGQWVQVEAVIAPNCDESGRPLGQGMRQ